MAPLARNHNHASCIVETAPGRLLVCWYRGSGERTADDAQIAAARRDRGAGGWSKPFVMADTPGFPDCNPSMAVTSGGTLMLFYVTILDHHWESALLRARYARRDTDVGPPRWFRQDDVLLKPGATFAAETSAAWDQLASEPIPAGSSVTQGEVRRYRAELGAHVGDLLRQRLGWMPRAHPLLLPGGRIVLGVYSDGFDMSAMAISDDEGRHWHMSRPIVGAANVQPSIARRHDGTLVAFFRDNGPFHHRVMQSYSTDRGETWTAPAYTPIIDPGAGVEVLRLRSGRWILVHNDTVDSRRSLAVDVSEDEGRTWRTARHLEQDQAGPRCGSYSYPSVIQSTDGLIHVTYSFSPPGGGETIKHAWFTETWLLSGAARPVGRLTIRKRLPAAYRTRGPVRAH